MQITTKTPRYALIGAGRLARHFGEYFSLLRIPYLTWSRGNDRAFNSVDPEQEPHPEQRLGKTLEQVESLLLLISDDAIADFIKVHDLTQTGKALIHCSGSLSLPEAQGVHPLMSFTRELYDLETYKRIPFVTEAGRPGLSELLPELSNISYAVSPEQKPLYHAYCVASGNFTSLLWSQVFKGFSERLGLPRELLYPYMEQVMANLQRDAEGSLTGPLVRGDRKTIEANLGSLKGDPLGSVYRAFVEFCEAKTKSRT